MHNFKKFRLFLLMILACLVLGFNQSALAEDIVLKDLSGQSVNLSSYKGKPLIIFFWTTWCPYCRKEIKTLDQMYLQMQKEGITVFAVNIGESGYRVKNFFKNYPLNLRVLIDTDSLSAQQYNVMGVPTYVFIADSGLIISDAHTLPEDYKSLLLKLKK